MRVHPPGYSLGITCESMRQPWGGAALDGPMAHGEPLSGVGSWTPVKPVAHRVRWIWREASRSGGYATLDEVCDDSANYAHEDDQYSDGEAPKERAEKSSECYAHRELRPEA